MHVCPVCMYVQIGVLNKQLLPKPHLEHTLQSTVQMGGRHQKCRHQSVDMKHADMQSADIKKCRHQSADMKDADMKSVHIKCVNIRV